MSSRTFLAVSAITGLSLVLTACSDSGSSQPQTVTETVSASSQAPSTTTSSQGPATATTPLPVQGVDPVFSAIDAVLNEYPGGIISDIDREDSRETYDIDVVVGQEVIELEVDSAGTIRIDEREGDNDDVRKANAATITAAEAITQALAQHPDGILDEIQLDEDDGRLEWEIELDDANRNTLVELSLPAR